MVPQKYCGKQECVLIAREMTWGMIPYGVPMGTTHENIGTQSDKGFYYALQMELRS